ncbi:MAG: cell envelope integrity protein CreD [Opitutaceae bacterium]|jgi:inner membrane protein
MNSDSFEVMSGVRGWLKRRALVFRLMGVAFIALLLFIPLGMVKSTLSERYSRQEEAVREITQTWGGSQRVAGPVLVVPYTYRSEVVEPQIVQGRRIEVKVDQEKRGEAVFLPERLEVGGNMVPSMRKRGIYETPVYAAKLTIAGKFAAPTFDFLALRGLEPQWAQARVCFIISDLRGTQQDLLMKWGGELVALQPGARFSGMGAGVHAPVKLGEGDAREFSLDLALNGSDALRFLPLGRQTDVKLVSTWADPSFGGAYLPTEREVGADGFSAAWRVSYYGRSFPQQWAEGEDGQPSVQKIEETAFGVSLMEPVNAYRTVERAIKYGILFITLVFTTFFLFEAVCGVRLNALNYLLVGAALCLFYLGVLALAEFLTFGWAYAFAAVASTLLIALYSRRILRSGRRAWVVGGMQGGVYGYLYFVLQMEDFALLAGTGALFAVLAAVMWATRNLSGDEEAA